MSRTKTGAHCTEAGALDDLKTIESLLNKLGLWYNIDTDKRPPDGKIRQIRVSTTIRVSDKS